MDVPAAVELSRATIRNIAALLGVCLQQRSIPIAAGLLRLWGAS